MRHRLGGASFSVRFLCGILIASSRAMPLRLRISLVVTSGCLLWGLAACSSNTPAVQPPDEVDAATEVFPADTEKVVATSKGGMPLPQSSASTCKSADSTFTLLPSSRQLTWKSCSRVATDDAGALGTWDFVERTKSLTDVEAAPLLAALRALEPSSETHCGADKPSFTVVVTTPRGETTHLDEFYACHKQGLYVRGMDAVIRELDKLTSSSSF